MTEYADKYIKLINSANNDEELEKIINKIYEDGFEDGINEVDY